ncbi:MAG: biopolymer transporter ExbD [Deltaproteobacteria bacterium]|nr:biopolymer transporter ExbD [Deltaproteobacteria bacterium]
MRTYRRRTWSSLSVNMVPLINVIFLITIFIITMINFSEVLIKKVNLPKADEAKEVKEQLKTRILIIVKSEDLIFLGRKRVSLDTLEHELWQSVLYPQRSTVQLRGDENISYDIVQKVMQTIATIGITRIEFATSKEAVPPLERDVDNEIPHKSNK